MPERPQVCAQGIVRHPDGDRLLVSELPGAGFQRLFGGRVEHGELSHEALEREFDEELGVAVHVGELLGVLQDRFIYLGESGHEVVFVHEFAFDDPALYDREVILRADGQENHGLWRSRSEPPGVPLYVKGWDSLLHP